MRKKILTGTLIVAVIVWILSLVIILGAVFTQVSGTYSKDIKNDAYLVAGVLNTDGWEAVKNIDVPDKYRVTYIRKDGKVLYDSKNDASKMQNHRNREEVKEALKSGYGESTRYSSTMAEKTTYSAVRLKNGDVVRVSDNQYTVLTLLSAMASPIIGVLVIAFLIAFFLSARISAKIVEPINQINVDDPKSDEVYQEIDPLIRKIREQNFRMNSEISGLKKDVDAKTEEAEFRKEFTANVSHELKTPLTSISGYAELIETGIANPEDIKGMAAKIHSESIHLVDLIDDTIKISQLDEKEVKAKSENVDLHELASRTIEELKAPAEKKKVKMTLSGGPAFVTGVTQILEEMVYNVCENAIKYNVLGGSVNIKTGEKEGRPFIEVADTGIGIPEKDLDHVYERFYRVDKSRSSAVSGTGLGLSIVKHAAAYHDAEINTQSKVGKGTTITITFPEQALSASI